VETLQKDDLSITILSKVFMLFRDRPIKRIHMPAIYLSRQWLRWCDHCNLPVMHEKKCGICSSSTRTVSLTPPGDVRPAFPSDIERIWELVDDRFGDGCGSLLVPDDKVILLNKCPDLDRLDEIIVDGFVVAALQYVPLKGWRVLPRIEGANRMLPSITGCFIKMDRDAEPFIAEKRRSALRPGVTTWADNIRRKDGIVILSHDGKHVLGTGPAHMTTDDIRASERGVVVRTRKHGARKDRDLPGGQSWEQAVKANCGRLDRLRRKSNRFIQTIAREHSGKPLLVSYSGGKDSLATLLLVMEAGFRPTLLFLDTGLEFPETVENVHQTAQRYELDLFVEEADTAFWDSLDQFGPPGKDFRWCCKTCKLGPASRIIDENFHGEVLSFIGQRANESRQRLEKGGVWRNPWVPKQIGASPIQRWNALDVWLYIFREKAEYNPIYEAGADRIGCWLCPASDMAEYEVLSVRHPDSHRWNEFLRRYGTERGYPEDWIRFNLWRWRSPPSHIHEMAKEYGMDIHESAPGGHDKNSTAGQVQGSRLDKAIGGEAHDSNTLEFYAAEGHHPCTHGISIEGAFSRPLDMRRALELLQISGDPEFDPGKNTIAIGELVTLFNDGALVVKARDLATAKKSMDRIRNIIMRSELCVGCGVCLGRCGNDALFLENIDGQRKIRVDEQKCIHCGKCLGPCPVVDFQ